jgi:formylglycine-generating enzyme required for sulfatase activity
MKTKLGLLLLMLLIAVGCEDSTESEQATEPVPSDPPVIELPSFTNTLDMTFKEIPAGTFTMGSPEGEEDREDDETQHKVTISKAFYMQTTEVTQEQWKALMGTEPWQGERYVKEGPDYVATYVSWDDAVAYCKKLSEKESVTYRLPTEAEWEYACRAETKTTWSFGDDEKVLGDYAWYEKNAWDIVSERYAHQVGLKKPNAFGLYDMHGNVFEWCHDYYGEDYYKQSPAKDPTGPTSGFFRVLRGGSWNWLIGVARDTRSARRQRGIDGRYGTRGFRLVRELDYSEGLRMRAAAITAAIGKGDWETVLALDPDNEAGTQLKAAAVAAALAKGDWKAVLSLDPDNREGLQLKAAAEKAAIMARAPITNTIGMKLNKIPAGTLLMGSPESEADREDDETQHKVTITKPFYMQTTEVTQGQWKAVMGTEPWKGQQAVKEGPNNAASWVSWDDAMAYCKKLSEKEGKTYRLPTEAEWEYACRAGTKTTWSFGDDDKELGDYAWDIENTMYFGEEYAHQVELKKPNAFGLYDMHGNVLEWCHDYFEEDYYKQSPAKDPTGPTSGSFRVLRGGSWFLFARGTRSARRRWGDADYRDGSFGFRVVRELD